MLKKVAAFAAGLCLTASLAVSSFAVPELGWERITIGDINNDGSINSDDYALQQQYILGLVTFTNEQKVAADVNGDNAITPTDHTFLKNYILGIPGTASVGTYCNIAFGDVELDGDIEIGDYYFLQSYINGQSNMSWKQLCAADLMQNGVRDGVINNADLETLADYLNI
jgi:hypothetical protein